MPARVKVKSEYLIVAKLSPTAPAGERLIVPDKFMWSECLEAESAGWGGSGAHRVDVLAPNHMLVPVLLKRSLFRKTSEFSKDGLTLKPASG